MALQGHSNEIGKNDSNDSETEIDIFEHFPLINENNFVVAEENLKNDKLYKKKLVNKIIC